jgi:hypothetical protein
MSDQTLRLVVAGVLVLHGLGHGGAVAALLWIAKAGGDKVGSWTAARSWLVPSLSAEIAALIASTFWVVSLVGFVAAGLAVAGVLVPQDVWAPLAVASAIVSTIGIVLFAGNWPIFNTVAALAVNVGVFVAVFGLHWTPPAA